MRLKVVSIKWSIQHEVGMKIGDGLQSRVARKQQAEARRSHASHAVLEEQEEER